MREADTRGAAERLEMTVNTSRVVEFPFDVPRMLVNNPDLVRVVPISPKSVQLSADELALLLSGVDLASVQRRKRYERASA